MSVSKSMEKPTVYLDDILAKFKLTDFYFVRFMFMVFILNINDLIMCSEYVFVAEDSSYRCADVRFRNDSCASLSNSTDVCTMWVYDDPRSFFAEFQLACQEWKRTLVGTTQSFGYGLGLLFIGPLSDRLGRKKIIMIAAIVGTVIGSLKSIVTNYWLYIIMELLQSTFGNLFSPTYILMIEIAAHEKRVRNKIICSMGTSIGFAFLALFAWLVPYWRNLLLALYVPAFIFLSYFYLLDESPRWLLSKGEKDKAVTILEKMAKKSKATLNKDEIENLSYIKNDEEISLRQSLKTTFSSVVMLKRFIICLIWWIASTFVSYGISINSVSLPGNKYVNYALLSVIDIPSKLTTLWVLNSFRRKSSLMFTFFVSAIVCFVQPFSSIPWLSITLYFTGQFLATIFFAVTYIFTSELFPTYTRNSMHSLCSSLGRVGSIIAPQTPLLMKYWHGLPSITFGAASLLAGCATLFAPKTASDVLPDTVQQAEALGNQQTEDNKTMHIRMQTLSS